MLDNILWKALESDQIYIKYKDQDGCFHGGHITSQKNLILGFWLYLFMCMCVCVCFPTCMSVYLHPCSV